MKEIWRAMLRDLGFSKKSIELRVDLLEKLMECERLGIDPFPRLELPNIPLPGLPSFRIPL
jgi:hypothetical protein